MAYCEYDNNYFDVRLFDELSVDIPDGMDLFSRLRQSEFLAGRYAAKLAISQARSVGKLSQVAIGSNKEPIFPDGLNGSITHTECSAICIVAPLKKLCYMGVDLQRIIAESSLSSLQNKVYSTEEINILLKNGISSQIGASLIFSAKESLFKAFSKILQTGMDFSRFELLKVSFYRCDLKMIFCIDGGRTFQNVEVSASLFKREVFTCVAL